MSVIVGGIIGGTAGISLGGAGAYLGARWAASRSGGRISAGLASPPCDRCGKPTGRPFLRQSPRTAWHCPACEAAVTDLMLAQFSPGCWITDPDEAEALGLTGGNLRLLGSLDERREPTA